MSLCWWWHVQNAHVHIFPEHLLCNFFTTCFLFFFSLLLWQKKYCNDCHTWAFCGNLFIMCDFFAKKWWHSDKKKNCLWHIKYWWCAKYARGKLVSIKKNGHKITKLQCEIDDMRCAELVLSFLWAAVAMNETSDKTLLVARWFYVPGTPTRARFLCAVQQKTFCPVNKKNKTRKKWKI